MGQAQQRAPTHTVPLFRQHEADLPQGGAFAQEWGEVGIRTNTVCPGMIRTPLTEAVYQVASIKQQREALVPMKRIGRPDDIGEAVKYLISPQASYVNGQNLVVDGGVADHMMAMIPGRPGKPPVDQP